MTGINWKEDIRAAGREVQGTSRFVLMFFHHSECGGCKKTISITFNDPRVQEELNHGFAPVQYLVTRDQDMTARYKVEWTPTFILADEYGVELERWVGYLPPDEFIAQIHLSRGLSEFHRNRFRDAETAFEWIIDNQPDSEVAPEARYYMGVALYKETGDSSHLSRTWEAMNRRYPGNYWTKKASAWS